MDAVQSIYQQKPGQVEIHGMERASVSGPYESCESSPARTTSEPSYHCSELEERASLSFGVDEGNRFRR